MQQTISEKQRFAAKLLLSGYNHTQAAALLRCTPQTIQNMQRSPLFRALLEKERKELHERTTSNLAEKLASLGDKAISIIEEKMDSSDENIQLRAAESILDRVIPKKTSTDHIHEHRVVIERNEFEQINEVLKEAGQTIDITPKAFPEIQKIDDVLEELKSEELKNADPI